MVNCGAKMGRAGVLLALLLSVSVGLSGCGSGGVPRGPGGKPDWHLMVKIDGVETKVPAQRLAIYLTEDDDYPEVFELSGPGLMLAGTCPPNVRVDYGEDWSKVMGKSYTIQAQGGGDRGEPKNSIFTLPGGAAQGVKSGTLTFEKVSGEYSGQDGDKTIQGTIQIELDDGKRLEGTFCVQCMTWG